MHLPHNPHITTMVDSCVMNSNNTVTLMSRIRVLIIVDPGNMLKILTANTAGTYPPIPSMYRDDDRPSVSGRWSGACQVVIRAYGIPNGQPGG